MNQRLILLVAAALSLAILGMAQNPPTTPPQPPRRPPHPCGDRAGEDGLRKYSADDLHLR